MSDPELGALRSEFPRWLIMPGEFADGWNLCAWREGNSTAGRMPDITRKTTADMREAIKAATYGRCP